MMDKKAFTAISVQLFPIVRELWRKFSDQLVRQPDNSPRVVYAFAASHPLHTFGLTTHNACITHV